MSISSPFSSVSRFIEKNSFVLDVGKPEFNGKLSTLSNASFSNYMIGRLEPESPGSPQKSNFSKKVDSPWEQPVAGPKKLSIVQHIPNQKFLKAAIINNIRRNSELGDESEAREGEINESSDILTQALYKDLLSTASKGVSRIKSNRPHIQVAEFEDFNTTGDEECVVKKDIEQLQRIILIKDLMSPR